MRKEVNARQSVVPDDRLREAKLVICGAGNRRAACRDRIGRPGLANGAGVPLVVVRGRVISPGTDAGSDHRVGGSAAKDRRCGVIDGLASAGDDQVGEVVIRDILGSDPQVQVMLGGRSLPTVSLFDEPALLEIGVELGATLRTATR